MDSLALTFFLCLGGDSPERPEETVSQTFGGDPIGDIPVSPAPADSTDRGRAGDKVLQLDGMGACPGRSAHA